MPRLLTVPQRRKLQKLKKLRNLRLAVRRVHRDLNLACPCCGTARLHDELVWLSWQRQKVLQGLV